MSFIYFLLHLYLFFNTALEHASCSTLSTLLLAVMGVSEWAVLGAWQSLNFDKEYLFGFETLVFTTSGILSMLLSIFGIKLKSIILNHTLYCCLLLQIFPSDLRLVLCSRVTYSTSSCSNLRLSHVQKHKSLVRFESTTSPAQIFNHKATRFSRLGQGSEGLTSSVGDTLGLIGHLRCLQHLLRLFLRVTDEHVSDLIRDQQCIVLTHHEVITGILQIL